MGHLAAAAEPATDGGGELKVSAYIAAHMGSPDLCGVGSAFVDGVTGGSEPVLSGDGSCFLAVAIEAKGHAKSLFFPGTVKSCSRTVDREVARDARRPFDLPLFDVSAVLLLDVFFQPCRIDNLREARRPSLIASAVCPGELICFREGSGTNPV